MPLAAGHVKTKWETPESVCYVEPIPKPPGFKASIKTYFWMKWLFLLHIAARISQLTKVHSLVAFSQCCSTCRVRKLDKTKLLSESTSILTNYSAKICQLALGGLCCLRVAFFCGAKKVNGLFQGITRLSSIFNASEKRLYFWFILTCSYNGQKKEKSLL